MRTLPLSFAALCALGLAFAPGGAAAFTAAPSLAEATPGQEIIPVHSRSSWHCHVRPGRDDCHSRYRGATIYLGPDVRFRFSGRDRWDRFSGRDRWDDDDWRERRRGNWKRDWNHDDDRPRKWDR
jgi:hypothetical protein